MKGRLFFTVLAGYLLIIFLGAGGIFLSLRRGADREFENYVFQNQLAQAGRMATFAGEYYRFYRGFVGLQDLLRSPAKAREGGRNMPRRKGGSPPMMSWGRFVITDTDFQVVGDTTGTYRPGERLNLPEETGISILVDTELKGYVFPMTSINSQLPPEALEVLQTIQDGAVLSFFLVIAASLCVAILLTLHIVSPIQQIREASKRIAQGDFSVRTGLKRRDEIGELGRSFNEMAASLARAEEWRTQIISDTAHELRTPVSLISGRLELISEGIYPLNREELEKTVQETQRLQDLIRQLEDLAGLERPDPGLEPSEFDFSELLRERLAFFAPALEEKGISLEDESGEALSIYADRGKIAQVIDNLLSNAIRYSPSSGKLLIRSRTFQESELLFSIEDSGPGIPREFREEIFCRFYRLDPSRSSTEGGRGLGLAIVREIVKVHGGSVQVEDPAILSGACFVVRLPMKASSAL